MDKGLTALFVIIIAAGIVSVSYVSYDIQHNNEQNDTDSISGIFVYDITGKNTSTGDTYAGTLTMQLDDGKIINQNENLNKTASNSVILKPHGMTETKGWKQPVINSYEYVAEMSAKNSMISNCTYYGVDDVKTADHGTLSLHIFENSPYTYGLDDRGICYVIEKSLNQYTILTY